MTENKRHLVEGLVNTYPLETAKKICQQIRENEEADYVIGVYHGGFEADPDSGEPTENLSGENEGYQICKEIDNLDVLLCGHQHRPMLGTSNNTFYIQSAHNGTQLAMVEIDTETGAIEGRLVDATAPADPKILDIVQAEEKDCQKWLCRAAAVS